MAPSSVDFDSPATAPVHSKAAPAGTKSELLGPLKYTGSLDQYESFDVTAVIGREYPGLQLVDILHDDAKIRDLALTGTCL